MRRRRSWVERSTISWEGACGLWRPEGKCSDLGCRDNLIPSGSLGSEDCVGLLGFNRGSCTRLPDCSWHSKPRPPARLESEFKCFMGLGLSLGFIFIYHLDLTRSDLIGSSSWWKYRSPFQRHGKCLWGEPYSNLSAFLRFLGSGKTEMLWPQGRCNALTIREQRNLLQTETMVHLHRPGWVRSRLALITYPKLS